MRKGPLQFNQLLKRAENLKRATDVLALRQAMAEEMEPYRKTYRRGLIVKMP